MSLGYRRRRPASSELVVACVVGAVGSLCAFAGEAQGLRSPEPPPTFSGLPASALIETLHAPPTQAPPLAALNPADLGPFQTLADAKAASAPPESAPPPGVGRSAGAPPDPVPTAIYEALARLVLREGGPSPLGAGDWRAARAAIGAFYADRGFRPVWVDADGLTPAGRSATAQIARASEDGLSLTKTPLPRASRPLDPDALAAAEAAVAAAVVVYAGQASGSRLSPARVSPILSAEPGVADPGEALAETAAAPDPGARLADFNPPQRGYRALREALRRIDDRESRSGAAPESVADAAALPDDPLMGAATGPGKRGRGKTTLASAAASGRASSRERAAILANMEMWRWEPRDMGDRRIEVNIPDFSVAVMDGDEIVMNSRVIVGKPDTPTPVFSDVMRYVLINPSWQVPESIIRKEILPRLGHFAHLGYEVRTVGGRLVVRQPPGEGNALGRLAFMFPNDHAVYLHDTPARALFSEDMRALSHGCVRVEDPERLAEIVLDWPESRVAAAIGGPERTVFLPRPLPVYIEYFTAFVDADGTLEQRPDVYGIAQRVAGTLSAVRQD